MELSIARLRPNQNILHPLAVKFHKLGRRISALHEEANATSVLFSAVGRMHLPRESIAGAGIIQVCQA